MGRGSSTILGWSEMEVLTLKLYPYHASRAEEKLASFLHTVVKEVLTDETVPLASP